MRAHLLALLALAACIFAGCAKQPPPDLTKPAALPPGEQKAPKAEKLKITAYINVSSGCQAETVELLNKLVTESKGQAELELVDFGSEAGEQRWRASGLSCMTLLFNGSPVCRFPGADGEPKTVVFAMPAGFSWTHDDLKEVFAALKAGKLETLTEEEARRELAPQQTRLETAIHTSKGGAEILLNGSPAFTITATANGKTPLERAKAAKATIDQWATSPIHPNQLTLVIKGSDISLQANEQEIIRVTPADAAKAQETSGKAHRELASDWLKAIKGAVVEASKEAPKAQPAAQ
jgi:hypothetical protein